MTEDASYREALALVVSLEAEVMRQEDAVARTIDLEYTMSLLRERLAIQERRAEVAEADAAELRGKLSGVLASASWRATRLLRAARGSSHPEHV